MKTSDEFVRSWEKMRHQIMDRLLTLGATASEAEEVTQETMVRLWQHWHGIEPRARHVWALRVAHNLWAQEMRALGRRRRAEARMALVLRGDMADGPARYPVDTVVERLESMGEWQKMRQALHRLSLRDRLMLWLVATVESPIDLARALGLDGVALRVRLHRARQRLGRMLEGGAPC